MARREGNGRSIAGLSAQRAMAVAAVFILLYFGVAIIGNAVHRYELAREQRQLEAEIATLQTREQWLVALRDYMQTDEFIERAARDAGLVRPGDIAVAVVAPTRPPEARTLPGVWWERYFEPEPR